MKKKTASSIVALEIIEQKIFFIRGKRVMMDTHLAELYRVETKSLKRQVKRNRERFPEDFMFVLTREEYESLRCQIGTLDKRRGEYSKYLPYAFTEQGVAMLSSVLKSKRAINVNIQIMRTFTKIKQMLLTHIALKRKLQAMEKKYDYQFKVVFEAIQQLLEVPEKPKPKIGFLR